MTLFGGVGRGDGTSPGALVTVNTSNGSAVVIGDPVNPVGITGLAFDAGNFLYASTISGPIGNRTSRLAILGTDGTLIITDIGPITDGGIPVSIGDQAFQPGTNVLFGIHSNADATAIPGILVCVPFLAYLLHLLRK